MNSWITGKDLMKHHYQIQKTFCSELYLEDITNEDYTHAQKIFEKLKLNLGDYHNLNVQSDTLLLADVFENFRSKCIEIYVLDLIWCSFFARTQISMTSLFKNNKGKIRFIN